MLRARRATFVAILSAVIERNEPPPKGFSAYAVAKLGLKGFALSVRSEYGSRGIRCFNVYPRFMNTSLTNGWNGRMKPDQVTSFPLSPETVAAKVLERVLSENTHPGDQEIVF
jgi:NAD(P)-dependent dehydrogenase (short-subunit alcohol dehydrogenase family)